MLLRRRIPWIGGQLLEGRSSEEFMIGIAEIHNIMRYPQVSFSAASAIDTNRVCNDRLNACLQ
jgi:hypothetical protein